MTSSDLWTEETAERYDEASSAMFAPEVLDPRWTCSPGWRGDGAALELAVGTGRVAVPLAARGVPVTGIELSEPMVARLRAEVGAQALPVLVGDMATTRAPGEFALVYLVYTTIGTFAPRPRRSPASATPPGTCVPAGGAWSSSGCHPCAGSRPARRRSPSTWGTGTWASTPTTW